MGIKLSVGSPVIKVGNITIRTGCRPTIHSPGITPKRISQLQFAAGPDPRRWVRIHAVRTEIIDATGAIKMPDVKMRSSLGDFGPRIGHYTMSILRQNTVLKDDKWIDMARLYACTPDILEKMADPAASKYSLRLRQGEERNTLSVIRAIVGRLSENSDNNEYFTSIYGEHHDAVMNILVQITKGPLDGLCKSLVLLPDDIRIILDGGMFKIDPRASIGDLAGRFSFQGVITGCK